ncbi:MAG TPA: prepilin-type N-terminal cleavage/methylation domain-containing protein [Candidatus Paceibacterota bacterium]|jgi:prepilin-type N-terminal cleavage/methylation domain-containing protein|nr:prepilin-type N-terminal cleavage/methylation domain-containing protein [Candidatus Paceibacterota bacterium]
MIKKYQGFTLIEMLVVVAIIGMLSSLIFGGLISSSRAKARDAKRIADIANMQSVLELYYTKFGFYPEAQSDWETFAMILTSSETGIGISKIPKDPLASTGKSYFYARSEDSNNLGQDYVLGAQLETKDQALDEDIDGNIFGVDCGESVGDMIYCVKP